MDYVGKVVRITDQLHGHQFDIGENVRITGSFGLNYCDDDGEWYEYSAEKLDGSDYWYIYSIEDHSVSEFEVL